MTVTPSQCAVALLASPEAGISARQAQLSAAAVWAQLAIAEEARTANLIAALAHLDPGEHSAARRDVLAQVLQRLGSEPTTEPASSEGCGACWSCLQSAGTDVWWMVTCAVCGNKRCPRAADHANRCTASNEPGQVGAR